MGNSSSAALPYTIGPETHPSGRVGSYGWSIHSGSRKSDGMPVTVFKGHKPSLAKTPLSRHRPDPSLVQILPALHHFHNTKRLIHPNVLRAHATLDTDYPDGAAPSGGGGSSANPLALSAMETTATTGDLIIVTECVVPLDEWLDDLDASDRKRNADAIAWGVHNLVEALSFLHSTAKMAHGLVCPSSVFVTPGGDFKLGMLSLATPVGIEDGGGGPTAHFRRFEGTMCPEEYRSAERIEGRWDAIQSSPVHAMDSFGLGALLQHVYSHPNAGTNGQVPQKLQKAVQRMQTSNVRMRPRVAPLLKCPVFDNPYVKAQSFLDGVAARPAEEKVAFFQGLPDMLNRGVLGEGVAVHKVLPLLIQSVTTIGGAEGSMAQDVNRREVLAVIPPLFQIAENYLLGKPEEFKRHITPIIPTMFAINDRGVRGALLSKVNIFTSQLEKSTINTHVFEPMCSGFTDSSAPLRELTLKSTIALVSHLTPANLEKLVRYLVRLQSDPEPSIRTNTVIFIGKVAPNLSEISRSKLILPAFTRSMKDQFTPCRLAGLRAVLVCKDYFDTKGVAEKVLPCVVPHLLDGVGEVREEAFKVVNMFMEVLQAESDKMKVDEAERAAANVGQTAGGFSQTSGISGPSSTVTPAPAPSSGGYLSGFSSWMTSQAKSGDEVDSGRIDGGAGGGGSGGGSTAMGSNQPPSQRPISNGQSGQVRQAHQASQPTFSSLTLSDAKIGGGASGFGDDDDDVGGWSDDDIGENHDDSLTGVGASKTSSAALSTPSWAAGSVDDDEDFFASFGAKRPIASGGGKLGVRGSGGSLKTAGTGKLVTPKSSTSMAQRKAEFAQRKAEREKTKQQAAVKKLTPTLADSVDDGWDDF